MSIQYNAKWKNVYNYRFRIKQMYRRLSGQKSVAFRHGGLIHEMSNYLTSFELNKISIRFLDNIEARITWEIKSTQETLFFSPYLKEKINRKRSQILFTLSQVLMHPAEKHTYLCNWLTTEHITRTWIVKQTPLKKIMPISKTITGFN